MKRIVALAFCALLVALTAESSAAAMPHLLEAEWVATDGQRYALFGTADSDLVRVYDTKSAAVTELMPPAGCRFAAVGAARVLWGCEGPWPTLPAPQVTDLATGATGEVSGWAAVRADPPSLLNIHSFGNHWIRISQSGNHYSYFGYLNWRTGQYFRDEPYSPTAQPDLDRPDLMEPLCPPFRRPRTDDTFEYHGASGLLDYVSPYQLIRRGSRVVLQRCGSQRQRQVTKFCPPSACEPLLGRRGRVLWTTAGRRPRVMLHRPGHKAKRVGRFSYAWYGRMDLRVTRSTVYVSSETLRRVYSLPLPR